jgi:signal transduction histidine kinase
MIIIQSAIIVILLCIIYLQFNNKKQDDRKIKYIHVKLNSILNKSTSEKILVNTENASIRELLIEVNKLLDNNQKVVADFTKTEISMRKMLSNISHDLKTPLTVVLGYIETIKLDSNMDSAERERLLAKVEAKAKEVLVLINNFFDLAKLEAGDKELSLTRVNINELCRKNILDFYDILDSKGLDVKIDIPEKPIYCLGNEEGLNRALNNLISNAIKYGSDGKAMGLRLTDDENYSYLEVWDKGKGIDELHFDRVFERMYTLEDSRNKLYQGSGLGLTITKRIVESMGGKIELISKPYERTSFIIKLKKITY